MWTANFVETIEGEIHSFGNLHSKNYKTAKDAWEACLTDFERVKKEYDGKNTDMYINSNCRHIEFDNNDEDVHYVWEIQKMV